MFDRSRGTVAVVFLAALFACSSVMVTADADIADAKPRKVRKKKAKKTGISKNRPIAGLKGGFVVSGSGEAETENVSGTQEYDDDSTYGLNAYALFPVSPGLRVGGSVWLWPKWDVAFTGQESDDAEDDSISLDVNAMGEYHLDFGRADGFAYAEGGYTLVLPPEDENSQAEPPTFSGFNFGGGIGGALYLSKQLMLRGDIKYEYYSVSADVEFGSSTITQTFTGNRVTLNAGVAFGL